MNNWGANHGAISYGHIGADLITLCSILRIPVAMHNVADKDIFRPKAWDAFGMDKEGADYRACAVYGPMYKQSLDEEIKIRQKSRESENRFPTFLFCLMKDLHGL